MLNSFIFQILWFHVTKLLKIVLRYFQKLFHFHSIGIKEMSGQEFLNFYVTKRCTHRGMEGWTDKPEQNSMPPVGRITIEIIF